MPGTNLLAILPILPGDTNSGLKLRLYSNLKALRHRFHKIHVLGRDGGNRPAELTNVATWESVGPDADAAFPARIDAVLKTDPEIGHILLEDPILIRHLAGTRLHERARLIVDMHNVESQLRFEIARSYPAWRPLRRRRILQDARAYLDIENEVLNTNCTIWACSDADRKRLTARAPERPIDIVPNIITDYPDTCPKLPETRLSRILYMGTYAYYPNRYAAWYICEHLAARLNRDMELHLVGHGPKLFMRRAERKYANLHVPGEVASVKPYLRDCGIMLMPIFQGGGTRLKALEACLNGLAIVSTAKGVEGLDLVAGEHYIQAEGAGQFGTAVETLRTRPRDAEALTERAYRYARENFTMSALERAIGRSLDETVTA